MNYFLKKKKEKLNFFLGTMNFLYILVLIGLFTNQIESCPFIGCTEEDPGECKCGNDSSVFSFQKNTTFSIRKLYLLEITNCASIPSAAFSLLVIDTLQIKNSLNLTISNESFRQSAQINNLYFVNIKELRIQKESLRHLLIGTSYVRFFNSKIVNGINEVNS